MAKDGESIRRQHFLSSRRHNLTSKVRLRNDQTPRNVYGTLLIRHIKMRSERLDINKICGGFINIRGRIKIMMLTKRH